MLRIELSALSPQELRRLHDAARNRGQAALAEQLASELAARPGRVEDWSPQPIGYGAQLPFEEAPDAPARPRRSGVMVATATLAAFVSAAVTWGLSVPMTQAGPSEPKPVQPRAAVLLASVAPVGAPSAAQSEAPRAQPVQGPEAPATPIRLARATQTPPPSANKGNRCYALPTAAERLVCGYPNLAAQDQQLRAAYDKAVAGGADRRELDRAQAIFRRETEHIDDRKVLADRYGRRIRELQVAAVTRPPPPPPPAKAQPEDPPF